MPMDKTGKQELQYSYQDKTDFKIKAIKKDKERHYLMGKGSTQEEDVTLTNTYMPLMLEHPGTYNKHQQT